MKAKMKIIIAIQFLAVISAMVAFYLFTKKEVNPTEAYMYVANLSENQLIKEEHIQKVEVPSKAVTEGFAINPDEIVGKFAATDIAANQYVFKSHLIDEEEKDVFADMDMTNYRKVPLPVSYATTFGGDVKPGDKVDLVFTGNGQSRNEEGEDLNFRYAKTFLSNVYVYSIHTSGGFKFSSHSDTDFATDSVTAEDLSTPNHEEPNTLTLLVTLDQAEEIIARQNAGEIRIVGRFDESESYETLGFVYGDYEKVFTAPANAETGRGTVQ